MSSRRFNLGSVLLTLAVVAGISLLPHSAAAQASGLDFAGQPVDPVKSATGKVTVLIFVRTDCPVSGRYAPTVQQISSRYRDEVRFWLVYPDKSESPEEIQKYLREYGYKLPALRDPQHALVRQSQAEITPESAVFDRAGRLIYHGRIDNLYVEFGRARSAATSHELDDAIQSALTGKPLAKPYISGVGCYISDLQ
jgi:thiol-disulfide isomerase/thioredoxin